MNAQSLRTLLLAVTLCLSLPLAGNRVAAQVAVRGETVYTMAGDPIKDGMVVVTNGKIAAVGPASDVRVPQGYEVLRGKVVTPGLIDAHTVVGLSGLFNIPHDQDQLDPSGEIQPQLRAIDAYNTREPLIKWIRSHGVTTIHTGHAPGALTSGQTMVAKTVGNNVDEAVLLPARAIAVTLTSAARRSGKSSPGTRGKMIAMLREDFIKAREYSKKVKAAADADDKSPPDRDLRLETLGRVLSGELAFMVTADKAQDITSALRLAREFDLRLWLDSAAEAYLLTDQIKAAGVPVLVHPTMARPSGERENMSFETASTLVKAGIPVALQSGYEAYVPKTRVVLFEAGMAAAHGLSFEQALATITVDAASILGIEDRVGSLAAGRDGDLAIFDGDPFEYTTHCIGVVINGQVVSQERR